VDGVCHDIIPFCAAYSPTQLQGEVDVTKMICHECQYEFQLSGNKTRCISPDLNCENYSHDSVTFELVCSKCYNNFTLNSENKCVDQIPNCYEINDSTSKCISCVDGFSLNADQTQCSVDFCEVLTDNGFCQKCSNPDNKFLKELSNGICSIKNPNCDSFADNSGNEALQCQVCKNGFNGTNCEIPSVANCIEFDSNGVCIDCKDKYYPENGSCYIENCKFKAKSICWTCFDGYDFDFSLKICVGGTEYCKTPNSTNSAVCDECESGFNLTMDSDGNTVCESAIKGCVKYSLHTNNKCLECDQKFYLNPTLNICLDLIPNCETKDLANETCTKCNPGYRLDDQCLKMSTMGCVNMKFNSFCDKCATGYTYSATTFACIENIFLCEAFSDDNVCSRCKTGSTLNDKGLCSSPYCSKFEYDPPCHVCLPTSDITKGFYEYCTECDNGYTLNNDHICLSDSCSNHQFNSINGSFECFSCESNPKAIFDNDNTCLEFDSTCVQFDLNGKCVKCQDQMTYYEHMCFESTNNLFGCLVDHEEFDIDANSDVTKCYKPAIGKYYDFQQKIIKNFVNKCDEYSNTEYCNEDCICKKCLPGYILFKDNHQRTMCYDENLVVLTNNHSESLNQNFSSIQFKQPGSSYQTFSQLETGPSCNWDHYISSVDESCIERTIIDSACVKYFEKKDGCEICKDNYFSTVSHRCGKLPDYRTEHCVQYGYGIRDSEGNIILSNYNAVSVFPFEFGDRNVTNRIVYDKGVNVGDEHFCITCDEGFHLNKERKCLPINPEDSISNCFSYDPTLNCLRCKEEFYLKIVSEDEDSRTTSCEASSHLRNCLISYNELKCEKCKPGYEILMQKENELTVFKCVRSEIDHCSQYHTHEGFLYCNQCKHGFHPRITFETMTNLISAQNVPEIEFLNSLYKIIPSGNMSSLSFSDKQNRGLEGNKPFLNILSNDYYKYSYKMITKCVQNENLIENCIEYDSQEFCKFCNESTILSKDRRSCLLKEFQRLDAHQINQKCKKQQEHSNGCNICMPGYYFNSKSDSCQECLKSDCLLCQESSPLDCQICKSGFYMDYLGNCLLNTFIIKDGGFGDDLVQEIELIGGVYLIPNFDDVGNIICSSFILKQLFILGLVLSFLI
jgi:hypothetical protein